MGFRKICVTVSAGHTDKSMVARLLYLYWHTLTLTLILALTLTLILSVALTP